MGIQYYLSKIMKKLQFAAIKSSNLHKTVKICPGSHVVNCEVNKYSYIGYNCTILNTSIGGFCSIADNCIIGGANHPMSWVSTSPVFHNGKNIFNKNFSNHLFSTSKQNRDN